MAKYVPSTLHYTTTEREFPPYGKYFLASLSSDYHKITVRSEDYHTTTDAAEDDAAQCLLILMGLMTPYRSQSSLVRLEHDRPATMPSSPSSPASVAPTMRVPEVGMRREALRTTLPGPSILPDSMGSIEPQLAKLVSDIRKIKFPAPPITTQKPKDPTSLTLSQGNPTKYDADATEPMFLDDDDS